MAALYPIHPGMTVQLQGGGTATVIEVLHGTGGSRSLVLRAGTISGRRVVAPYAAVSFVAEALHLRLTMRQVQALPAFDPIRRRHHVQQPRA